MNTRSILGSFLCMALLIPGLIYDVQAGATHYDYDDAWIVDDYINCTDEPGTWEFMVSEVTLDHVTPSGKGHFMWHAWWEGTLVGHETGYEWYTKGILQSVQRYSLNGDLVGGQMTLENSILKPLTPGAPRILLDVFIQSSYNANGDMVVDKFTYALNCLGKKN
ncbi:MAG: hypothetical protein OEU52_08855 [Xanthomonadales bacterium]|nr:hypothetical protein [Xanthomonadales bacterium]